jgi:hypothetical protein
MIGLVRKMNKRLFNPGLVLLIVGGAIAGLGYYLKGTLNWLEILVHQSEYDNYNTIMWIGIILAGIGLLLIIIGVAGEKK